MPKAYNEEFKKQCVDTVIVLGKPRAEVAAEYYVSASALGRWVFKAQGTVGTGSGSHVRKADPDFQDPVELAKRVAELELENEFFFKKSSSLLRQRDVKDDLFKVTLTSTKKANLAPTGTR